MQNLEFLDKIFDLLKLNELCEKLRILLKFERLILRLCLRMGINQKHSSAAGKDRIIFKFLKKEVLFAYIFL
jgi:hypothetical protein